MHQCYRLFAVIATTVPADPSPQGMPPAQQAKTDQMAVADASGLQQQPTNIVVTIRVDSPGDDGSISQTNVVVGSSNAANTSGTTQEHPTEPPAPSVTSGCGPAGRPKRK